MTEKQEHLLMLLREIDEICKKHQLRYVMAGGSLIGVVRNEGFIPWDDDVDIYMPRDDWDKFVELSGTEFPPARAVQCVDVDREYTNTFPRYADTASCAIHKHQLIGNDKAGEIIDVLTLDPIPPDDKEYEKYRTHMMIYSELVNVAFVYGQRYEIPVTLYLKYLLSYHILGRNRTLKKLEKIMFSYKEEECSRYAMRWGGCPFLFDKDMMFPVKYMEFEGIQVMVPNRVSDYLIWHYGDEWSYIPPHDERSSHNAITVDGITYEELRGEYMQKIDTGRIRRDSVFRKFYTLAVAKKNHRLTRKRNLMKARSVEMDLDVRIRESSASLAELVEKHEFSVLNEIFSQYFQVQLSAEFIGREDFGNIYPFYHPVLLDIPEEAFRAAMMTLIYTERVAKAYRMLRVKENLDSFSPELAELKEDIVLFRKAVCHYEMKEKEQSESLCRKLLEKYPDCPGFLKLLCRLVMERAMEKEDTKEAEAFLAHAMELFGEDGYFLKYQADLVLKKEGKARALPLYARARETTNNGITHLEIEKYANTEKEESLKECRRLIAEGRKDEAAAVAALWERLLPEDGAVCAYPYLVKASFEKDPEEQYILKKDLEKALGAYEDEVKEKDAAGKEILCEAMTVLMEGMGYPRRLAEMQTEMMLTADAGRLQAIRGRLDALEVGAAHPALALKLAGDIERKRGCTKEAFVCYRNALKYPLAVNDLEEIAGIMLKDLYKGGKKLMFIAKKMDASDYMDQWLGKYGALQEIQALQDRLLLRE